VIVVLLLTSLGTHGVSAATLRLEAVATGFEQPLFVTGDGTGSSRLFVVEKAGRIRVVQDGAILATPFLDISRLVNAAASERGLLGLAFHPDFGSNGYFYVDYTGANGDIVITRYTVSSNPDQADVDSAEVILTVPHREADNHNGGMLAFGPHDGYLYIAVGDGGSGQSANGQKITTLLGKILRIDVDHTTGDRRYAIPADNPFANRNDARPEIWAYGLRNPFRFSFDRETATLFIGDVGQRKWEEIDEGPAGAGGINYGWAKMEGRHCYRRRHCKKSGLRLPIHEDSHEVGNVVTGGYVYRGQDIPALVGTYVFTDFGSSEVWGLTQDAQGNWQRSVLLQTDDRVDIASFGESDSGELFAVDLVAGVLYRLDQA
jgi:glucose/arabinose dehydrogenase